MFLVLFCLIFGFAFTLPLTSSGNYSSEQKSKKAFSQMHPLFLITHSEQFFTMSKKTTGK